MAAVRRKHTPCHNAAHQHTQHREKRLGSVLLAENWLFWALHHGHGCKLLDLPFAIPNKHTGFLAERAACAQMNEADGSMGCC